MCDVLSEMRTTLNTLNIFTIYRYRRLMATMIEEVQTMGNRMEAALADNADIRRHLKNRKTLKKEVEALEERKSKLEAEND